LRPATDAFFLPGTGGAAPFLTTFRIFLWNPMSARGLAIAHTGRSSPSPPSLSSFALDGVLSFFSFFSFPIGVCTRGAPPLFPPGAMCREAGRDAVCRGSRARGASDGCA